MWPNTDRRTTSDQIRPDGCNTHQASSHCSCSPPHAERQQPTRNPPHRRRKHRRRRKRKRSRHPNLRKKPQPRKSPKSRPRPHQNRPRIQPPANGRNHELPSDLSGQLDEAWLRCSPPFCREGAPAFRRGEDVKEQPDPGTVLMETIIESRRRMAAHHGRRNGRICPASLYG